MIIGARREEVIENIKNLAEKGEFHTKAELDDPVLTKEQKRKITDSYLKNRNGFLFKLKTFLCVTCVKIVAGVINRNTKIIGIEKIPASLDSVIITSNHFSQIENTVIRHLTNKLRRPRLGIISQTTNFAMTGIIGFIMNYADTIPVSDDPRYLAKGFLPILKERLARKKEAILLYPEQEMWFNYRKPRPPKNGAYYFAAKLGVPVLSCFVEIKDTDKDDTDRFKKVEYVLHILDILYPDKDKTVSENTEALSKKDYELKKTCYEKVYGKELTYDFHNSDIAGWKEGI